MMKTCLMDPEGRLTGVDVAVADEDVAVGVGVAAEPAVGVEVAEVDPPKVSTSRGALPPDSRDARLMAVEPAVDTPKLYTPSALTNEVTSRLTHAPVATAPEVARVPPEAGMLLYVMPVSLQLLSATLAAEMPTEEELL